ncbi:EpsG family protein [Flavobacterium sp.]|uniref:EpsG family protein n=1 Tax=Flavobacterium sp. TaxID=239 RepID=UPI00261415C4|nr:EpsG family protein [Flavobacterium sp.]MDG2431246.1 EpsG family protein [Flavobacterium sp.]
MIDFIPIEYYNLFYYNFLLLIVLFTWINAFGTPITAIKNLKNKHILGYFILIVIIVYMGFRPISFVFGDMGAYSRSFASFADGIPLGLGGDLGFNFFMMLCAKVMTVNFFFFVCSSLYILPLYLASKKLFQEYWFYSFFILICSFSFWSYGTNGIRNGLATSIMLLALAYSNKKIVMVALMFVAISFHKSLALPVAAYLFTLFFKDSKKILYFWILCIPISIAAGGFFESLFASLGFDDERISYLTSGNINNDDFSSTGFRWDFLIYSALPVYAGWYFIFKRKYKDIMYAQLFNIYLITNGFWILVIRANFSNRFAYLSWFMMGIVIIYPLLKKQFFKNQHKVLGTVLALYFSFTYIMNVILTQ